MAFYRQDFKGMSLTYTVIKKCIVESINTKHQYFIFIKLFYFNLIIDGTLNHHLQTLLKMHILVFFMQISK